MTKHRKDRQARRTSFSGRHSKSSTSNHWIWLMTGMLLGILGITAIFLFVTGKWPLDKFNPSPLIRQSNTLVSNNVSKKSAQKSTQKSKIVTPKKEPARFEFYQLLPGMEVPLPEATTKTTSNKPTPALAKTEKKIAAAQYLIQAGTFRGLGHAASLKKRIDLTGMSAKIQKIDAEDGTWFRVTLGPFSSETMALSQKTRLAKEKISGILILQRQ